MERFRYLHSDNPITTQPRKLDELVVNEQGLVVVHHLRNTAIHALLRLILRRGVFLFSDWGRC